MFHPFCPPVPWGNTAGRGRRRSTRRRTRRRRHRTPPNSSSLLFEEKLDSKSWTNNKKKTTGQNFFAEIKNVLVIHHSGRRSTSIMTPFNRASCEGTRNHLDPFSFSGVYRTLRCLETIITATAAAASQSGGDSEEVSNCELWNYQL